MTATLRAAALRKFLVPIELFDGATELVVAGNVFGTCLSLLMAKQRPASEDIWGDWAQVIVIDVVE